MARDSYFLSCIMNHSILCLQKGKKNLNVWPSILSAFNHYEAQECRKAGWVWVEPYFLLWASLVVETVKNLPAMWKTQVQSLNWEDPLKKGMATHSSILAWKIPCTEESGQLQSMGFQRAGSDWATNTHLYTFLFLPVTPHCTPGSPKEGIGKWAIGILVKFYALWPGASCLGSLTRFGHSLSRTTNVVAENPPSIAGLASCYNPIDDVLYNTNFVKDQKHSENNCYPGE